MKITTNQERLNELFNSDSRNDTAIAADLNVSKQALSAWRKGTRSPKKSILIKIAQMYSVSLEWLMGFDVPKRKINLDLTLFQGSENTKEARIISGGINKMPPERREQALNLMKVAFAEYADYFKEDSDNDA